jgi:hypothetical protein
MVEFGRAAELHSSNLVQAFSASEPEFTSRETAFP